MRVLTLPSGQRLRVPSGWDAFQFHGHTYRWTGALLMMQTRGGWVPIAHDGRAA